MLPSPRQTILCLRLGAIVYMKHVSLSNGLSAQKAVVGLVECSPSSHRFSNTNAMRIFARLINYRECQSTAVCHIRFNFNMKRLTLASHDATQSQFKLLQTHFLNSFWALCRPLLVSGHRIALISHNYRVITAMLHVLLWKISRRATSTFIIRISCGARNETQSVAIHGSDRVPRGVYTLVSKANGDNHHHHKYFGPRVRFFFWLNLLMPIYILIQNSIPFRVPTQMHFFMDRNILTNCTRSHDDCVRYTEVASHCTPKPRHWLEGTLNMYFFFSQNSHRFYRFFFSVFCCK